MHQPFCAGRADTALSCESKPTIARISFTDVIEMQLRDQWVTVTKEHVNG